MSERFFPAVIDKPLPGDRGSDLALRAPAPRKAVIRFYGRFRPLTPFPQDAGICPAVRLAEGQSHFGGRAATGTS